MVLVDGVRRMPLWQDSAHPRVLRSGTAIAGALRPQRTIGAADKRVSWHTASHPESCTRCIYVGKKCDIPSTPLPWQCFPCESADPCFMAAGSIQNAYTTRPLSPEDETMIQSLHDKWGHPSNSKFIQIIRLQGTKQSEISY